jgi:transcriptional regulator with XRE-family HTH domain
LDTIEGFPKDFAENAYKKIGENVAKIRKEKGFSQLKLSLAIGHSSVSIVSCAEICHNNAHFNIEHLLKIAYVLDVNVSEFFQGVDLDSQG